MKLDDDSMDMSFSEERKIERRVTLREPVIHAKLNHRNIIKMKDAFICSDKDSAVSKRGSLAIIMNYARYGNLEDYVKNYDGRL